MSQSVVDLILAIGKRRREPTSHLKAALETGRIESNFQNLPGGDADSQGWRQERASIYKDPRNLQHSINRFFDETDQLDHGQHSWELAADVQRPAAQYRGRYKTASREAAQLLGTPSGARASVREAPHGTTAPAQPAQPSGPSRSDLLRQYLAADAAHDPDATLMLAIGLKHQQAAAAAMVPASHVSQEALNHLDDPVAALAHEADRISKAKVPYELGGGHQPQQVPRGAGVKPLDCSGAVSRVLGVDPREASQFASFGKPGRGKRVTIYANGGHVLMEIDGHFFGTSHANPEGGAGWIPRRYISKQYLARFVARHPAGE